MNTGKVILTLADRIKNEMKDILEKNKTFQIVVEGLETSKNLKQDSTDMVLCYGKFLMNMEANISRTVKEEVLVLKN